MRLDALLVERGLFTGRERAKEAIARGEVRVNGRVARKPSEPVEGQEQLELTAEPMPYVSRGGLKLEKALRVFPGFSVEGHCVLDIGASTGGFTDCLLQHGARRVLAIDVGRDQLAGSLRADPRVVSMEGVNARALTAQQVGEICDGAVMDVSFISITKIIPALEPLVKADGYLMALIKPQFEAGKADVGKKGVVKDIRAHRRVLWDVTGFVSGQTGFAVLGLDVSPIRGPEGNAEFLLLARKGCRGLEQEALMHRIDELVNSVHA